MNRSIIAVCALLSATSTLAMTAYRSGDFVRSLGVCVHWGYPDTPYGSMYTAVRDRLYEVGIQSIRDGLNETRAVDLGKSGVRYTVVADPPDNTNSDTTYILDLLSKIKQANSAGALIDAVEGPNEPDLFWVNNNKRYKNQPFPQGVVAFQKDLYRFINADPATAAISVIGPSLGKTYDPGGGSPNPFTDSLLGNDVDFGNFHPYPGGNPFSFPEAYATISKYYWFGSQPSGNIDEWPYAFNTYKPPFAPKPMVATETGYSTFVNGVTEKVHAKYMPRLFLEYFRKGIRRTWSYEFIDEWPNAAGDNREAHFGLLRNDVSPKPAFAALKNLIGLLKDSATTFQPDTLNVSMTVSAPQNHPEYTKTQYVHSILFEKSTRKYYLVMWHEIANTDNSSTPPREIDQPVMPSVVTVPSIVTNVTRFSIEPDGQLLSSPLTISAGKISMSVPDNLIVLELITTQSVNTQRSSVTAHAVTASRPLRTWTYSLTGECLGSVQRSIPHGVYIIQRRGESRPMKQVMIH